MKILKTILLTAIAVVAGFAVSAQVADLQEYAQGRVTSRDFDAAFIGCDGNRAVYVENASSRKKQKTELVAYNMDRQELERVPLTEGSDTRCYGGFINGQHVDLLMADWKGSDMTLYRYRLPLTSLSATGERQTLVDYKGTSGDKMGFRLSASPDQKLLALLYYVGRETQPTEVQVGLYSRELEEYWKVDTKVRNTSLFYLTDSGEVALGGVGGQGCKITIIDGETEVEHIIPKDDLPSNVAEMNLARIAGGRLYFVGTQRGENNGIVKRGRTVYTGIINGTNVRKVFSLCFDTRSKRTSTYWHEFSERDICRINGKKDNYRWSKNELRSVQFFSLNQTMVDRDGYYAMMDQMWTVTVDGVKHHENRTGQVVMRVDNDGRIEWVKVFRMSQMALADAMPMIHYRWVSTEKGPMLVWAEAKKTADYAEEKVKLDYVAFKSSTAAVLTAAIVDRQGNIVRQHWPLPAKTGIQGRPVKMENGNWLIMLRGKSKGKLAVLKVK